MKRTPNVNDLSDDECLIGFSIDLTKSYLQWLVVAQELGIETDPRIIGLSEFCDNSITKTLVNFTIVESGTYDQLPNAEGYDTYKLYTVDLESTGQVIHVDYFMTNLLDELVEIDESEIKWVDVSQWGGAQKGYFVYSEGALSMSANLRTYIGSCLPDQDCDFYSGEFEVYRNDCYIASVYVSWSRY